MDIKCETSYKTLASEVGWVQAQLEQV